MQDSHVLSSFEELLRRPDFVLEPKCYSTLVGFRGAGGKPENAVEFLSDGYVGYAQMASLVCQWLRLANDERGGEGSSQPGASQPSGSGAGAASDAASKPGPSAQRDEFYFLKEFTKQKFDSEKLAGVFSRYGGKPPPWLENLTQDPRGRQLIYELSAAHRNCLLLNYGIQKILMQGHKDEVASVGSSLASYFSVFHRLLATRLRAVANLCCSSGPEATSSSSSSSADADALASELRTLSRELVDSCGHSMHTYLHAQHLLTQLGQHPRGEVFKRMSQELEAASAQSHTVVWSMLTMFMSSGSSPEAIQACSHVALMLAAHGPHNGAEHLQLANLYRQHSQLSVQPIQHPQFIKLLISGVFTPGKLLPADAQAAAVELLARATSCRDKDPESQGSATEEDMAAEGAAAARMEATREALQAALELGHQAPTKMTPQDAMIVYQVADIPVACVGLLHYIKCLVGQKDFYHEAAAAMSATPVFARLAIFVGKKHPELLHLVIDLFHSALTALGSQRAELAKVFLDGSVVLLRDCHCTAEVTAMIDQWGKEGGSGADPSLVRYLIIQVLSVLGAPYSPSFAAWLLGHMVSSGIRRARDTQRNSHTAELLHEFAQACSGLVFSPALGLKESLLLQDLQQSMR